MSSASAASVAVGGKPRIQTQADSSTLFVGSLRRESWLGSGSAEVRESFPSDSAELLSRHRVVPVVTQPTFPRLDYGEALQKWEGQVLWLTTDGFVAKLADLTGEGPEEDAEFSLDDVSVADRPLVKPGGVFYWSVGYRVAVRGQRSRESVLRFRRLPTWSKADRQEAATRAAGWKARLRWGE